MPKEKIKGLWREKPVPTGKKKSNDFAAPAKG
jgi:hypothetical protein